MTVEELINRAIKKAYPDVSESEINLAEPTDWSFGDYTTNLAFKLSKTEQETPFIIAEKIAGIVRANLRNELGDISVKNGFVNFSLSRRFLLDNLSCLVSQKEAKSSRSIGQNKKVVLEYFQNNVAKPPHVGHLRSAVVGDSLARILRYLGFNVVTDTHIGDWGTQFGILIYAFKKLGDRGAVEKDPINELNKLYVSMTRKIDVDPGLRDLGKAEFMKLEEGDSENRKLWQWFVDVSLKDFERYRQLLKLKGFDYNLGESFYEDKMQRVLDLFRDKGLVSVGETGERYIDLKEYSLGRCILYKSDGASTYHMRDFATYIYRKENFDFYRNYYVVDNRQEHHFNQLFKCLELIGYPANNESKFIALGFMSLPEGPISTRKGNIISLERLINEANKRALEIIDQKNPDLEDKDIVASQVALAAIKYFDLSHNPKTEFTFTWDKALSFEGNTGPYLQYTHARICGILRKVKDKINKSNSVDLGDYTLVGSEMDILRKLTSFQSKVESITESLSPNLICNYLFELAQYFNSFYQSVPVLAETNPGILRFRMDLCLGVALTIKAGLMLLGIESPQEM